MMRLTPLSVFAAASLGLFGLGCAADTVGPEEEDAFHDSSKAGPGAVPSGEPVVRWNANAVSLTSDTGALPQMRELAMVHVAMHDAVNLVDDQFKGYAIVQDDFDARGADPSLASAAAARNVLVAIRPAKQAQIDALFQTDLNKVTSPNKRQQSLDAGAAAANAILSLRANDGSSAVVTYTFGPPAVGVFQRVPPSNGAAFPQWPFVTPFVMTSGSQFRQDGPSPIASAAWANDYNETRTLGRIDSATRTADQTHAARFWVENPQFATNTIARNVATSTDKGLWVTARAFALVNVSIMEASIATWDAKYHYNFWRPYTAIRGPDGGSVDDGRADTPLDPTWLPLNNTPGHPEYPCAHCELSAAGAVALTAIWGNNKSFTITTSTANPAGSTRTFANFNAQVTEASNSRIWGGFHFRESRNEGLAAGQAVGQFVMANAFKPE
jgi:hypothetical protein